MTINNKKLILNAIENSNVEYLIIFDKIKTMSRTKHHKNQRINKCGLDFGAKYNCDRGYGCGHGHVAKLLANKERRNKSKKIIGFEIDNNFCSLI